MKSESVCHHSSYNEYKLAAWKELCQNLPLAAKRSPCATPLGIAMDLTTTTTTPEKLPSLWYVGIGSTLQLEKSKSCKGPYKLRKLHKSQSIAFSATVMVIMVVCALWLRVCCDMLRFWYIERRFQPVASLTGLQIFSSMCGTAGKIFVRLSSLQKTKHPMLSRILHLEG